MHANEMLWGIELETTLPAHDGTPIGAYHHGLPVPWLPAGWKAERDGSIEPQCMGRKGCEFVSPRLRGFAGLDEVCRAAEAISARGGRVNHTCGVHVTVEFTGDASALARLITLVANHETGIYASTGTHRREGGRYSKTIKVYGDREAAKSRCQSDRYHVLNLTHLARGNDRIEFRAFAGTLNATKIAGHIMTCLGLIELATAKTRCSAWTYAKKKADARSCWDRPGGGETELNRLFYRLGWTTGWYKGADRHKRYGELSSADGRTPDWAAIKAKLLDMARKYDREANDVRPAYSAIG